jgi:hypothetical protein
VSPHSPQKGPRGLGEYFYLIITWFLVVQSLSNEMVETTKTEHFTEILIVINIHFNGVSQRYVRPSAPILTT